MRNKAPALVDVPVLIAFFARPDTLEMVFEKVKKARPSKVFLFQDGPRDNRPDDIENITKCRTIVENIDWECDVYTNYQQRNVGCCPGVYIGIKWAFEYVDRCIILEDDCVPSISWFRFCKEMLEKYYDDKRIDRVYGMNHVGISKDCPNSYFFSKRGSIWGWATWKRNIDQWEERLDVMDDEYTLRLLRDGFSNRRDYKRMLRSYTALRSSGRADHEAIGGSFQRLNSMLGIVPVKNMICNVGISSNTTHAVDTMEKLPKGIRRVFHMRTYELAFPLQHPKYVLQDVKYKKEVDRIMGNGYPLVNAYRFCESVLYRLIAGDLGSLIRGSKRRLGYE